MPFRHLWSPVLALIIALPLPAQADAPAAKDVAVIGDCLRKQDKKRGSQEADEAACLMAVARPCMGGDETKVRERRQIDCLDRERLVWDQIIDDSSKTMMNALDAEQQAKLRQMQQMDPDPRSDLPVLVRLFPGHDGQSDDRLLQQPRDRPARDLPAGFCRGYSRSQIKEFRNGLRPSAYDAGQRQPWPECGVTGRIAPTVVVGGFVKPRLPNPL